MCTTRLVRVHRAASNGKEKCTVFHSNPTALRPQCTPNAPPLRDECPHRGMLATAMQVLEQIHTEVWPAGWLGGSAAPAPSLPLCVHPRPSKRSSSYPSASPHHLHQHFPASPPSTHPPPTPTPTPTPPNPNPPKVFTRIAARSPQDSWDVRAVMEAQRRSVLRGVRLVFSRVIPLELNPRSHPLWRLAEQFGGACEEGVGEGVTHVVGTHGGTDKVRLCVCVCGWLDEGGRVLGSWRVTGWCRVRMERVGAASCRHPSASGPCPSPLFQTNNRNPR